MSFQKLSLIIVVIYGIFEKETKTVGTTYLRSFNAPVKVAQRCTMFSNIMIFWFLLNAAPSPAPIATPEV